MWSESAFTVVGFVFLTESVGPVPASSEPQRDGQLPVMGTGIWLVFFFVVFFSNLKFFMNQLKNLIYYLLLHIQTHTRTPGTHRYTHTHGLTHIRRHTLVD